MIFDCFERLLFSPGWSQCFIASAARGDCGGDGSGGGGDVGGGGGGFAFFCLPGPWFWVGFEASSEIPFAWRFC